MTEKPTQQVVNVHWWGEIEKLPANTVYVGRPGPYGNPYSSKSGKYVKEECVALHRVELYQKLCEDPHYFQKLKQDLEGRDLACWCKNQKTFHVCHGDNYLHILSERLMSRVYDKYPLSYIMDDLRAALTALSGMVWRKVPQESFLDLYLLLSELRIDIQEMLSFIKTRDLSPEAISMWVAILVVDCESALIEQSEDMVIYWLEHAHWVCHRFFHQIQDRTGEPMRPGVSVKRLKKEKVAS